MGIWIFCWQRMLGVSRDNSASSSKNSGCSNTWCNIKYYKCPKCNREVWAYGTFDGNICWECPGTLVQATAKVVDATTLGVTSSITSTVADTLTDTKRYYKCPKCNREVWAYGTFDGNICWECPGTLVQATAKVVDATTGNSTKAISSTLADTLTDTKRYYNCPKCNREVWAYGTFEGNVCWECSGTLSNAAAKTVNAAIESTMKSANTTIANTLAANSLQGFTSTATDVLTGTKRYYKCPKCDQEVWAYGIYEGTVCQNCSGTVIQATAKTVDAATENAFTNVTSTTADILTDTKRYYPCPKCRENVWAYGAFQGNTCWNCRSTIEEKLSLFFELSIQKKKLNSFLKKLFCFKKIVNVNYHFIKS
ncbi:hypothetical protein RFI_01516 [Reticulomyxa filosa]|uniref:Uncharacterized protein n=1 Tax=Reticulomyxa filosa TaxID=46433 RepID=X6PBV8_RETFI|nr:hypothetical protein RFI_01516 [Reticulomyxa filosa]|eukprot:ETO35544.1 hypothetical protein RFI_01516 [Reticulomyxa filosa]